MNNGKTAFGMNFEEFCEFYRKSGKFNNDKNTNHPPYEDGESFVDFIEKGCAALIKENSDIVCDLI